MNSYIFGTGNSCDCVREILSLREAVLVDRSHQNIPFLDLILPGGDLELIKYRFRTADFDFFTFKEEYQSNIDDGLTFTEIIDWQFVTLNSFSIFDVDLFVYQFRYLKTLLSIKYESKVTMNLYSSIQSIECLPTHRDFYPIIVLQLAGEKVWHFENGEFKVTKSGDILIIPPGVEHRVETRAEHSVHLAIGIHLNHVLDLIQNVLLKHNSNHLWLTRDDTKRITNIDKAFELAIKIADKYIANSNYFIKSLKKERLPRRFNMSPFGGGKKFFLYVENIYSLSIHCNRVVVITLKERVTINHKLNPKLVEKIFSGVPFSSRDLVSEMFSSSEYFALIKFLKYLKEKKIILN